MVSNFILEYRFTLLRVYYVKNMCHKLVVLIIILDNSGANIGKCYPYQYYVYVIIFKYNS